MAKRDYSNWTKEELVDEIKNLNNRKKYGLVWEEKFEEFTEQCKVNFPILKEVKSRAIKTNETQPVNILIEGDNYQALSILNYTHTGKVNGIYIDPPYNTGSCDWKYNNNYVDKDDPYRHSKWISFMYKRLKLAKNLLSKEGVICVTIDDYELPRLLLLMEEIFGENNHLGTMVIRNNPSGRSTIKGVSICHEYAVFFGRSNLSSVGRMPRNEKQINRYKKKDKIGPYEEVNFRKGGGLRKESPIMFYPLFISDKSWRIPEMIWNRENREWTLKEEPKKGEEIIYPIDDMGREKRWKWGIDRLKKQGQDVFVNRVKGKNQIFHKNRMAHETVLPNTWWDRKEYSATDHGTRLLKEMFGELKTFEYPKAVEAVKDCLRVLAPQKDAIFLDFFAGSGTTAQAVMELNKEDSGNRRFILNTNNENNICEKVSYERIKKVIEGYTNKPGRSENLKYYRTGFISAKNTDENKRILVEEAIDMICFKEDCFNLIKSKKGYKLFKKQGLNLGILFDLLEFDNFKKELSKLEGPISVYIFSLTDDDYHDEFSEFENLTVTPIPMSIIKTYRKIFGEKK